MFSNLFRKQEQKGPRSTALIVAQLNARIHPIYRGEIFEGPLDDELKSASMGEVTGGATMQGESGEIEYCDIEIQVTDSSPDSVNKIIETLERLGAPKGSKLKIEAENRELPFGLCEGLAVYLNGTDLPAEAYKRCDSHFVYAEFERLLEGEGRVLSYWEGQTKTMFYLYGKSAVNMKKRISPFINSHPLYQKCRVEQIV